MSTCSLIVRSSLVMLVCGALVAPARAQWTVTRLNPPNVVSSVASGVSGGQQVGAAYPSGPPRAAVWSGTAGSWVNLHPAGASYSSAFASTGALQVGYAGFASGTHAGLWSGTAASWLDLNPAGAASSSAQGASGGQQVGYVSLGGVYHASLWNSSPVNWVDLHPAATTSSAAIAIGGGQQGGTTTTGGVDHAALWTGTAATWVDLNPAGATTSAVTSVSGGRQGGYAIIGGVGHGCVWSGTAASWVDLAPPGALVSEVMGMSGGQQVGYVDFNFSPRASLWSGTAASWTDLGALLPASPGYGQSYATAIWSSSGVTYVVGYALNNVTGQEEAVLWTRVSNDQCANAWPIAEGAFYGATNSATIDGASVCGFNNGPDVWYAYTASATGVVNINTCGSRFDTVLSIHSGCPGVAANQLACNDDSASGGNGACGGGYLSGLDFATTAGTTYYIRVCGYNGGTGDYELNVIAYAPANDNCPNATAITPGTYTGTTGFATNDGGAVCGTSDSSPDVWYSITPASSGLARLDTCGSLYDTVLSVHAGCPGTDANQISCSDDAHGFTACSGTIASVLNVPVAAGQTYYVRVSGFNGAKGGYTLHYTLDAIVNEDCPNATAVAFGTYVFNTTGATTDGPSEANCSFCCGDTQVNQDIWYSITAPCGRQITIDTLGSSFDTKLAVYAGCPATNNSAIVCNDDANASTTQSAVSLIPAAGTPYYIRVGGYFNAAGAGVLHVKTCLVDFNCDGTVSIQDIFDFLNAWFAGNPRADFNGTNGIMVQDIFDFLNAWFAGCP